MFRSSDFKIITALMVSVLFQQALFAEIDTQFIPPDSSAAVILYPKKILASDHLKMFPMQMLSAMSVKQFGFDPVNIDSILLVAAAPAESGMPRVGLVARFSKPTSMKELMPMLDEIPARKSIRFSEDGPMYLKGLTVFAPSFYQLDDKTVILGNDEMLRAMVAQKKNPQAGSLSKLVNQGLDNSDLQVFVAVEPVRDLAGFMISPVKLPPQFEPLKKLPSQIDTLSVKISIADSMYFETKITATNEQSAQEVQTTLKQFLSFYQKIVEAQRNVNSDNAPQKGVAVEQIRISKLIVEALSPKRDGNVLTLSTKGNEQLTPEILIAHTTGLVMSAMTASQSQSDRQISTFNIRQLILGLHNYHDTYIGMPSQAMKDKAGKPLLSWRVHILLFIEEGELFDKFHLDEPWNSEHNIKLVDQIPDFLRRPGSTAAPGMTNYQMPLAKGLPFQEHERLKLKDVTDGLSKTIALLEVPDEKAVIWTKPDDYLINLDNPFKGLVSKNQKGFTVVLFDGIALRIDTETMTKEKFIKLLTHAGGELVDF